MPLTPQISSLVDHNFGPQAEIVIDKKKKSTALPQAKASADER